MSSLFTIIIMWGITRKLLKWCMVAEYSWDLFVELELHYHEAQHPVTWCTHQTQTWILRWASARAQRQWHMLMVFCFQTHHPHLTHFFLFTKIKGVFIYNINKHCKDSSEKKKLTNKPRYFEILSYKAFAAFTFRHLGE